MTRPAGGSAALRPVDLLERIEWAALAAAAILAYAWTGNSWLLFALLILAPDLAMLGYLAGPRMGAIAYNAVHTLAAPLLLLGVAWLVGGAWDAVLPVALIWVAHIGIDRALGYGFKLPSGFRDTHMGRIGKD